MQIRLLLFCFSFSPPVLNSSSFKRNLNMFFSLLQRPSAWENNFFFGWISKCLNIEIQRAMTKSVNSERRTMSQMRFDVALQFGFRKNHSRSLFLSLFLFCWSTLLFQFIQMQEYDEWTKHKKKSIRFCFISFSSFRWLIFLFTSFSYCSCSNTIAAAAAAKFCCFLRKVSTNQIQTSDETSVWFHQFA